MDFNYTGMGRENVKKAYSDANKLPLKLDTNQKVNKQLEMSIFDKVLTADKTIEMSGAEPAVNKDLALNTVKTSSKAPAGAVEAHKSNSRIPSATPADQVPRSKTPPASGPSLEGNARPLDPKFLVQNMELANKTVKQPDGSSYTYNEQGYITEVRDANGNKTHEIRHYQNGSANYTEYEYDSSGNKTREIERATDGSVLRYSEYEYNDKGNETRTIIRDRSGNVERFIDTEYNDKGNNRRSVIHDKDGNVLYYFDDELDNNGNMTRSVCHNPDGTVSTYSEFFIDENGNFDKRTYNPDGTPVASVI